MYDIEIMPKALEDLDGIAEYLYGFSPVIAAKYKELIKAQILSLRHMPKSYALVRVQRLADLGFRWAYVRNYVIFFTVDEERKVVTVQRISYSSRDYDALL